MAELFVEHGHLGVWIWLGLVAWCEGGGLPGVRNGAQSSVCVCVCLFKYLSVYLSVRLSVRPSVCCLIVYHPACLSLQVSPYSRLETVFAAIVAAAFAQRHPDTCIRRILILLLVPRHNVRWHSQHGAAGARQICPFAGVS